MRIIFFLLFLLIKLQIATRVFVSRTESSLGHFEDLNNRVSVVIICPVAYRIVHFKD